MNIATRLLPGFCPLITLLSIAPIHLSAGEIFPIANSSAIESGCDAAFDGHNYLVGVQGGPFGEGPITAQLVSPTGALVRGGISPGKSGGMPRLAFDGVNYFMVWAGSEADSGLKGQFVSTAGDLVGSVLNIHPTASLTPTATSVAFGGGKYLACWSDGTRLLGQMVNPDRTLSGASFTISGATLEPRENAVVFDGANFFVAFNGGGGNLPNIYGQMVSPQGGLIGGTLLIDDTPDPSDNPLTVSCDGSHYLVAFSDEVGGWGSGTWHLYGKRVSTSGTVLPERLTLADNPGAQRFPFAAFDGSYHLIVWGEGAEMDAMNLVMRFFDPAGQPAGAEFSPFTPQGSNRPLSGVPLFNGTDYFVTAAFVNFTADQEVASADVYGTFVPKNAPPAPPFTYVTNNGTLTITGYTGAESVVAIPDKIAGLSVTAIANSAFQHNTNLTSVGLPASIASIGALAFFQCTKLTAFQVAADNPAFASVGGVLFNRDQSILVQYPPGKTASAYTIPDTVTTLGDNAFAYCAALTTITNGASVVSIGNGAFSHCAGLTAVCFLGDAPSASADAFLMSDRATVYYLAEAAGWNTTFADRPTVPVMRFTFTATETGITIMGYTGSGGVVSIPRLVNGLPVTSIGYSAFSYNSSLTSVTIPDTVTSIEGSAFDTCTGLTNVVMGTNVASIGGWAFGQCIGLTGVTIPNSVTNIATCAFQSCWNLTEVAIPRSVVTIGFRAFANCSALRAISVDPDNPLYASTAGVLFDKSGSDLIQYPIAKEGSEYTIPNSVTSIAPDAFFYCSRLTRITIHQRVTAIGEGALFGCSKLSLIEVAPENPAYSTVAGVLFNKSHTVLMQYPIAKEGTEYTIPNSVTEIGNHAFDSCLSLTNVVIPDTVTRVGDFAFHWCTSLKSIAIPESVTVIGQGAFRYCTSLTALRIPNRVTSIPFTAFEYAEGLTTVTIGHSVTNIDYGAFLGCSALTEVYFQGNAPAVVATAFESAPNVTVFYSPSTTGWGATLGGRPAMPWDPHVPATDPLFGVRPQGFGFMIAGTSNLVVVVEAAGSLVNPVWLPVATNTLTSGSSYFVDPRWTNSPTRFYRLRSP